MDTKKSMSVSTRASDPQGALIESSMPDNMKTSAQPIAADGPQTQFSVSLYPLPAPGAQVR